MYRCMGMERHYAHAAGSNFLESLAKAMKSSICPLVPYLWLPVCDLPPGGSTSAEADATRTLSLPRCRNSLLSRWRFIESGHTRKAEPDSREGVTPSRVARAQRRVNAPKRRSRSKSGSLVLVVREYFNQHTLWI
jgi:hypothetical protein